MTYVAGVDVGSANCKAVVLSEKTIVSFAVMPSGRNFRETAEKVLGAALDKAGLKAEDLALTVATGCGAASVLAAGQQAPEVSCHSRGVRHLLPSVRTVIDIGGTATRVIRLDESGRAVNFVVNDKCAAGSGRFLQVIARVLEVPLAEIGPLSLKSTKVVKLTTGCAVFSESEAVSRIAEGEKKEDILAGVHAALAGNVATLVERVRAECDCAITGGGAMDIGLVEAVREKLVCSRKSGADARACHLLVPDEPQITAALGAALFALEKVSTAGA